MRSLAVQQRAGRGPIFYIRVRMAGLFPVVARDTYVKGRGRMLIRLLDLFTAADGQGDEYNTSELVTYLNDAVMIAPTMLFVPGVAWTAAGGDAFDVSLTDHGRTVSARVSIDASGAPTDFSTTDRFCYDPQQPGKLMRTRWTTPIDAWEMVDRRPPTAGGQAIWHLPAGPFPYAAFRPIPGSLVFNVPPGG